MKTLILLSVSAMFAISAYAEWTLETLDSEGITGYWTSIRLDSGAYLHIVYKDVTDNALMHTWQNGSGWNSETVDNCNSCSIAMVLDSQDMPVISYWDNDLKTICVVRWTGSEWNTDVLASAIATGYSWPRTDIEVDSLDRPHVIWFDGADTALHCAIEESTGVWNHTLVDSSGFTGIEPSLCLDSVGIPHVSYGNGTNGHLYHAFLDGSDWDVQVVDSTCEDAGWSSIELDQYGNPHILYLGIIDVCDSPVYAVILTSSGVSGWKSEVVVEGQYTYPSSPQGLALDEEGYPHLCTHFSDYGDFLSYHYKDASGWHTEGVDGPGAGWDFAICLDSYGAPNVSYFHITEEDLIWAHRQQTGIWSAWETFSDGDVSLSPVMSPVSEQATVLLKVQELTTVYVSVFDVSGRLIEQLPTAAYPAGTHSLVLGKYKPGVYFCVAHTEEFTTNTCFALIE